MNKSQRKQRARIGAHALHAAHDARQTTAKARETFRTKFEKAVDPDRILTPEERARRAQHALKAHMAKLALRSAQVRSERAAGGRQR